jgi:hypothetical protein
MLTVRVGGVPEHFNLAWHLAIESGMFTSKGIQIDWVDVPGGTGAMCKALRNNGCGQRYYARKPKQNCSVLC